MKICVISYDYFGYDKYIITELQRRKIITNHIDLNQHNFSYSNKYQRVKNFFGKLFFKKNLKKIALNTFIMDQLNCAGIQDIILVIRPDLIDKKTHLEIKKNTKKYICYLYDSCSRFKIDNLLIDVFDTIYSFDLEDVKKYNFKKITNFIYNEKVEIKKNFLNRVFLIISLDERINFVVKFIDLLNNLGIENNVIVVGSKKPKILNSKINFLTEKLSHNVVKKTMSESEYFLDIVRKNHNGLSFRIFEALAFQRKIITTNQNIKLYDFYNPKNILVLDENCNNIDTDFFLTPYIPIPDSIYEKYTISRWVDTVFEL